MSKEVGMIQHNIVVGKYAAPVADYTMKSYDYTVRPSASPETGPWTLTLPPVAEAAGRIYSIVCRDADGTNTITLEDNNNDSECWPGDVILNGKCDRVLAYSDGLAWQVAASVTTFTGTTGAPTTAIPQ